MNTLFGITLVLYLLKLSAGKGFLLTKLLLFLPDNDSAIRFLLSISQVIMSISNLSSPIPRPRPSTEERERKHTLRSAPVHSPNFLIPKHGDGICSLCNKASLNNELRDISE